MRVVPPLTGRLDMALSNYAKAYRNADLITDLLFPRVEVARQTDVYWIYGKESLQLTEQTLRAAGTPAQETRFLLSTDRYFCASHALKSNIPDEDRLSNTTGDLEQDAVDLNQSKILLDREIRAMAKVTNAANYPSTNTFALSGSAQWDQPTSDPISIFKQGRKAIAKQVAMMPNTLVLGFDVAEALRTHPQLLQRFQYNVVTGYLADADLAKVFNVQRVIVGGAVLNDPISGLNSFGWSNFALLVYLNSQAGPAGVIGAEGTVGAKQISFGKSFTWINAPGTIGGYGVVVARHPDATAKADMVGVDWYSDEKITAPEAGYLVTNVLATAG